VGIARLKGHGSVERILARLDRDRPDLAEGQKRKTMPMAWI
jgi:hypothetical protein